MALLSSLLFAITFVIAVGTILATLWPARARIVHVLRQGSGTVMAPLPAVRLTSHRGIIRQRGIALMPLPTRVAA